MLTHLTQEDYAPSFRLSDVRFLGAVHLMQLRSLDGARTSRLPRCNMMDNSQHASGVAPARQYPDLTFQQCCFFQGLFEPFFAFL